MARAGHHVVANNGDWYDKDNQADITGYCYDDDDHDANRWTGGGSGGAGNRDSGGDSGGYSGSVSPHQKAAQTVVVAAAEAEVAVVVTGDGG